VERLLDHLTTEEDETSRTLDGAWVRIRVRFLQLDAAFRMLKRFGFSIKKSHSFESRQGARGGFLKNGVEAQL
jgi:hypothetical protein